MIEEEQKEHVAKLNKMEREMEEVFERKVREKKQKLSDAELTYGSLSVEATEQMKEIGELGLHIWRTAMIEPLEESLVTLALPLPLCRSLDHTDNIWYTC